MRASGAKKSAARRSAAGHEARDAGARALLHAGDALDVGGHRRRPEDGADDRSERVRRHRLASAWQLPVHQEAGALGDADERPDRVEEPEEEEDEHRRNEARRERAGDVEPAECRRERGRAGDDAFPVHEAGEHRGDRRRERADEDRAPAPAREERRGEERPAERDQHGGLVKIAERDERARRGADEAGPLEADERQEEADARGDRVLQRGRDRVDQPLAQPDQGEREEREPGDAVRAERDPATSTRIRRSRPDRRPRTRSRSCGPSPARPRSDTRPISP
jgi:hypothetical protein